jgi:hypothetical protein
MSILAFSQHSNGFGHGNAHFALFVALPTVLFALWFSALPLIGHKPEEGLQIKKQTHF